MFARVFFYICTVLEIFEMGFSFKRTHRIFSIQNIFFVTIVLNFIMYLANWSTQFTIPCNDITYIIIATTQCAVMVFDLVFLKKREKINDEITSIKHYRVKRLRFGNGIYLNISIFLLLVCVVCSMVENYVSYGMFMPFLHNVDSHKNTAAIFGTIWRSLYPVGLIMFLIEYKDNRKKKWEFFFLVLVIAYLLLSGGSRLWSVISIGAAFIFWLTYVKPKLKFYHYILMGILLIGAVYTLLEMGATRLNVMTYKEKISYNGPFSNTFLGEAASWYYGYFPYSFYNLNLTLINIQSNHLYTYGQFFILPFLYVTKIYKLLGVGTYDELALSVRVIVNSGATVATAYFEFFADFGIFFILPIIFYLTMLHKLEIKNTVFSLGAYSYCIIVWGFFCFYNVFSNGIPYTFMLLLFLVCKFFVVEMPEKQ